MAKVVTTDVNDTPIAGVVPVTDLSITVPAINWSEDWVKTTNASGLAVLSYKPAPFDAPQSAKFSVEKVADVYSRSSVDRSYQLPYKRGLRVLAQADYVISVTDDEDPTYRVDLPLPISILMTPPASGLLPLSTIYSLVLRTVGMLFEKGNADYSRIEQLLKGAAMPSGL